jgi:hypothetical protein
MFVAHRCGKATNSDATRASKRSLLIAFWLPMTGSISDRPVPSRRGRFSSGMTGTTPIGLRGRPVRCPRRVRLPRRLLERRVRLVGPALRSSASGRSRRAGTGTPGCSRRRRARPSAPRAGSGGCPGAVSRIVSVGSSIVMSGASSCRHRRRDERVRDALDQGDLVGDLRLGVELVLLPDPPRRVVAGAGSEPEALDDEALALGVDDERHEVRRQPPYRRPKVSRNLSTRTPAAGRPRRTRGTRRTDRGARSQPLEQALEPPLGAVELDGLGIASAIRSPPRRGVASRRRPRRGREPDRPDRGEQGRDRVVVASRRTASKLPVASCGAGRPARGRRRRRPRPAHEPIGLDELDEPGRCVRELPADDRLLAEEVAGELASVSGSNPVTWMRVFGRRRADPCPGRRCRSGCPARRTAGAGAIFSSALRQAIASARARPCGSIATPMTGADRVAERRLLAGFQRPDVDEQLARVATERQRCSVSKIASVPAELVRPVLVGQVLEHPGRWPIDGFASSQPSTSPASRSGAGDHSRYASRGSSPARSGSTSDDAVLVAHVREVDDLGIREAVRVGFAAAMKSNESSSRTSSTITSSLAGPRAPPRVGATIR